MRADRLERWALREGPVVGLALFRIVVGLMALRYLVGYADDYASDGFYRDYFFLPYTSLIPQPTRYGYLALLAAGYLSAAALIIGWRTRAAAMTTFLIVTYHFSLNEIWHRHNRYFLVLALLLLCLGPSGRALSFDAGRLQLPPTGPVWTGFLIKAQMTLIYLASATSKALDPAWRGGQVLELRGLMTIWDRLMPGVEWNLFPPGTGVRLMTLQALASEFLLALLLWFRPTRRLAIWWGVLFHGFIELEYSVLTFSYLTMATYFVYADLKCGEKTWTYSTQHVLSRGVARVIPWLDWLFQIRLATNAGTGPRFVDRDGTQYEGIMCWIMLGANLPVLFPICYPLSWWRFSGQGRCAVPIESDPAQPGTASPRSLIVVWTILYLVFITPVSFVGDWQSLGEAARFWDLPWFFVLMCLVAGAYHQAMMRSAPTSRPMAGPAANPRVEPSPATS